MPVLTDLSPQTLTGREGSPYYKYGNPTPVTLHFSIASLIGLQEQNPMLGFCSLSSALQLLSSFPRTKREEHNGQAGWQPRFILL